MIQAAGARVGVWNKLGKCARGRKGGKAAAMADDSFLPTSGWAEREVR